MEQRLEEKLREILQLANKFKSHYTNNEMAVRAQLINPILNILGWDTTRPEFVKHNEPNNFGKIPDYTLLKETKNVLVVEAKNLNTELKDDKIISQLASYSYSTGISFGILTNGMKWLLFNTFQKNPNERIVWTTDLEKDDENFTQTIKKLITISYQNIEKLESSIQRIKALESAWGSLCPNPKELIKLLSVQLKDKTKKENPNILIDILDIENFVESKINELLEGLNNQGFEAENKETVESFTYQSNKKAKTVIKVTFPDNSVIFDNTATSTFVKTLEKIGLDKVKPLNIMLNGSLLIDNKEHPHYQQVRSIGGFFIMVHSDTKNKINRLQVISKQLNLNLKVESIKL